MRSGGEKKVGDENKDKKVAENHWWRSEVVYQNVELSDRMLGGALGLSFGVGNCRLVRSLQPDEGHRNFNLCG